MSKVYTYKDAIKLLKPKLPLYLKLFDRDPEKGNFRCLLPERHKNRDDVYSMGIVPQSNGEVAHCFTCNLNVDIFHAAHILEGLPINGSEFYEVTVPRLCKLFGIDFDFDEDSLDADTRKRIMLYRAYEDMSRFVIDNLENNPLALEELEYRKWNVDICKKVGVGSVPSHKEYITYMNDLGWNTKFLKDPEVDLYRKALFNNDKLTFIVYNESGRPVGVASRVIGEHRNSAKPKYMNTVTTPIYKKHELLYNIHNIPKGSSVYVVEGYADVVTLIHDNVYNVVATGGVMLSKEHIALLNRVGVSEFTIAFDNDQGGEAGTRRAIEIINEFPGKIRFNIISYKHVPEDFQNELSESELALYDDPDSIVRAFGAKLFTSLEKVSPFKWTLYNVPYDYDKEKVIDSMFDIIMKESSPIKRKLMAQELAQFLGEEHSRILDELKHRESIVDNKINEEVDKIVNKLIKDIRKGTNPVSAITNAYNSVKFITVKEVDIETKLSDDIKEVMTKLKQKGSISGFNLGQWKIVQDTFDGFTKDGMLALIGAEAHHGKTSFLRYLSYLLAINNDDVSVLYFSLEDNKFKMIPAFVAIDQKIKIRDCMNPYNRLKGQDIKKFEIGFKRIEQLINEKKLLILDAQYGTSFRSMENIIDNMMQRYPDRNFVVMIDHFYKISDNMGGNLREKYVANIEYLQLMATVYNIPIFTIVELNKLPPGKIPDVSDITETGRMAYEADIILLLYNEIISKRKMYDDVRLKWAHEDENGIITYKPILEVYVHKNKLTGADNTLYFRYDNTINDFQELTEDEVHMIVDGADQVYGDVRDISSGTATVTLNGKIKNNGKHLKRASTMLFGGG